MRVGQEFKRITDGRTYKILSIDTLFVALQPLQGQGDLDITIVRFNDLFEATKDVWEVNFYR